MYHVYIFRESIKLIILINMISSNYITINNPTLDEGEDNWGNVMENNRRILKVNGVATRRRTGEYKVYMIFLLLEHKSSIEL